MRINKKKIKESESKVYSFGFDFKITEPGLSAEEARARILNECDLIEGIEIVGNPNSEATSWDEDEYFGTKSKAEFSRYKPFEEVELGEEVHDQNDNVFIVVKKGSAWQLVRAGFDKNGEMREEISEGIVDKREDSVAVEYNGRTYVYVYGYDGVWTNK